MTRQTEARANRELAATHQRPWEPPQAPRKSLPASTVAKWALAVLAAAGAYSFWHEVAEFFGRIG